MKPIPFLAAKPKVEIVPVGSPSIGGILYLQSKGASSLTPNENPIDDQELRKRQQKLAIALEKRVKEIAQEKNISKAEARKKLYGSQVKQAGDEPQVEVDDNEEGFFDFLGPDEQKLVFDLEEDSKTIKIRAATRMIQYRAAIPVIVREPAEAKSREIKVEPLSHPLGSGDVVRFGDYVVALRNHAGYGAERIEVQDTPIPLKQAEVGYLCDSASSQIKVGFPEWTEEDTKDLLGEQLILAIHDFYMVEAGEAVDEKLPEGEEVTEESVGEQTSPSSIGDESSSGSNTSDALTLA